MKRLVGVSLVAASSLVPWWARAENVYDAAARVSYVHDALIALREADPSTLEDTYGYIGVMERNECRSVFHRLRVDCLIEAARRNCRGRKGRENREPCRLYSDIIVTNKLSERYFVSTEERFAIMKRHRNYRRELRRELRRRYGSLVAGFGLSTHPACEAETGECLARGIDAYCLEYADTHNLSWQHCTAAVTWFIATSDSP
ncbi:hypothetical protein ACFL6C_11260 [Myxococcota bacterium]